MVETAGQALGRITDSLQATNVLSQDYANHIIAWAYKAVELAHKEGLAAGRAEKR